MNLICFSEDFISSTIYIYIYIKYITVLYLQYERNTLQKYCIAEKVLGIQFSRIMHMRTLSEVKNWQVICYHSSTTIIAISMHICMIVRLSAHACTLQPIVNKCQVVTGCGHSRLAAAVDCSSQILYKGCTPEENTSWTGVVAKWLLHCDRYVRHIIMSVVIATFKYIHCITSKLDQKFYLKRNSLIYKNFSP